MEISQNARTVLERRYLAKDDGGKPVETVEGLFRRVARAIAASDLQYKPEADVAALEEEFYRMMTELEFLPNSPTLMNAGRPLGQLSACFVLPVADSMEDIFEAIKQAALIHKSGGGTGFSFSRLRAAGSTVNSTGGVASGPISFMRVFNMATEAVKQGGTRRGANMGILRVDHPDILDFINCKADNADITNFNISVGITEAFMKAVEKGEDYDLIEPSTKKAVGRLNAKEVFDKIVYAAWRNGEPGIIFLDRLNRDNVVPAQGEIESTNPCGEQPLLPYESCNLGSINLVKMIEKGGDGRYAINWNKLADTIGRAVHFLDNVIDANQYPLPQIDFTTKQTRKIGLGIMGWADMLLYLGIPYNSDEAVKLADKLMGFITTTGRSASARLARERGPFPLFHESIYKDGEPLRNATVTTIAPTGTLSILAGVSSGVEPVFAYVYIRSVMDRTEMLEVSPVLKEKLTERGLYSDELMRRIAEEGTIAHMEEIPEDIRRVFVSAHDISPLYHTKMQAAFQAHTDNAVSKTVNFPQQRHQGGGGGGLHAGLPPGLQGRHHLPGRQPGDPGPQPGQEGGDRGQDGGTGRRCGAGDRDASRPALRHHPPPPAGRDPGTHRKGGHWLRQPIYHGELRRKRYLRGVYQHGQGGGLSLSVGGYLPAGVHRPALRAGRQYHCEPAQGDTLSLHHPSAGDEMHLLPRCHRPGDPEGGGIQGVSGGRHPCGPGGARRPRPVG